MSLDKIIKKKFFYGWFVLFLCFMALVISLGIRLSFGAFLTSWELEYGVKRGSLALISAVGLVVYGIFQPILGRLSDSWGSRVVLCGSLAIIGFSLIIIQWLNNLWVFALVYGGLISIGYAGASNVVASAIVIQWFNKKQGLALGIVTSGMAVGQMIIVPLSIYMVNNWQWEITFLVFGLAILFIVTPLTFILLRSKPKDIGLQPYGMDPASYPYPKNFADKAVHINDKNENSKALPLKESVFGLFKTPTFWLLMIPYFFCGFTDLGLVNTHLIPYAEGKNYSSNMIAVTISLMAVFNIAGTIAAGYAADYINRSKILAFLYLSRTVSLIILMILPTHRFSQLLIFGILYGISDMAPVAIVSSLCAKLFGKFSIGAVIGIISACHQFGAAAGSFLPGLLYDWTGSYNFAFIFSIDNHAANAAPSAG